MAKKPSEVIPDLYRFEPSAEAPGMHDITEVEHLMVKMAKQLEDLFKMTPCLKGNDFDALAQRPGIDPALRSAMRRPRVIIGKSIVENYFWGRMPLVNDIIYTKFPSAFIDRVPKLRDFSIGQKCRDALDNLWNSSTLTIPSFLGLKRITADQSGDDLEINDNWPPHLPTIRDEALRKQVFTHRSAASAAGSSQAERSTQNNERLEFKGDTVLGGIIVDLIYHRFPHFREGDLSKLKSRLVCNSLLYEFSLEYDLPRKLDCSAAVREAIDKSSTSKVVADLFEAYIGGLEIDRGYEEVRTWLSLLYEPLIRAEIKESERIELDKNAKTELYRIIGASQRIDYIAKALPDGQYEVDCTINGSDVIGTGVGENKRDAGSSAAMAALGNTEAIRKYSEIRLAERSRKRALKDKASTAKRERAESDASTPTTQSPSALVANKRL